MLRNIICLHRTVSIVVKMLPAPLIDVGEYYLSVVREVVVPSFHHVSRWCACFLFVGCSLRPSLGVTRTSTVKPVLEE